MNIQVDREGSLAGLARAVATVLENAEIKSLVILSCDANELAVPGVDALLKGLPVPVCGGIFPAVIFGREKLTRGSIVVGLAASALIETIPAIGAEESDHVELIDRKFEAVDPGGTMLVFVDGFAERIEDFIGSLFTVFGLEPNYIGGGAGSLSMRQAPCLFTNDGVVMDAAVLALLETKSGVGVSHGWESVSGPFRVTESDRNVVKSIDWEPAFDLYRSVVDDCGPAIDEENFFDIAKAFPFGIAKLDGERVVRDPVCLNPDKSMVFVGEVPEGTFIDILNGDEGSLIAAAGRAKDLGRTAFAAHADSSAPFCLFIDCISRVLFLGERFGEELAAASSEGVPLVGACTIGEIASSGNDLLEFYNKTSVVAFLEDS